MGLKLVSSPKLASETLSGEENPSDFTFFFISFCIFFFYNEHVFLQSGKIQGYFHFRNYKNKKHQAASRPHQWGGPQHCAGVWRQDPLSPGGVSVTKASWTEARPGPLRAKSHSGLPSVPAKLRSILLLSLLFCSYVTFFKCLECFFSHFH